MSNKTNIILGVINLVITIISLVGLVVTKSHWFLLPIPVFILLNAIFVLYIVIKAKSTEKKKIEHK